MVNIALNAPGLGDSSRRLLRKECPWVEVGRFLGRCGWCHPWLLLREATLFDPLRISTTPRMVAFARNLEKCRWTRLIPCRFAKRAENDQNCAFSRMGRWQYVVVKTKELTPKQILSAPCTTCGAALWEACELHTGAPRTEPHRDRKLSAAEAVETKPRQTISR